VALFQRSSPRRAAPRREGCADVFDVFSGKCLYLSGLTPEPMTADDDYKLLNVGIGFTNMVERATKGSADLTRKEIKRGQRLLSPVVLSPCRPGFCSFFTRLSLLQEAKSY